MTIGMTPRCQVILDMYCKMKYVMYCIMHYVEFEVFAMNNPRLRGEPYQSATVTTRVPLHLKRRWQQAAALRGLTLTDFLITAANNATCDVFEQEDRIELSERDSVLLAEMLARPPRLNERLRKAISEELGQMSIENVF